MSPEIQGVRQQSYSLVKFCLMDRRSCRTIPKSSMRGTIKKLGYPLIQVCRITALEISGYFDMLTYYCSQQKHIMKQVTRQKHLNISTWYAPGQEVLIILFFLM